MSRCGHSCTKLNIYRYNKIAFISKLDIPKIPSCVKHAGRHALKSI